MKRYRIQVLLFVLVLLLAAACSGQETDSEPTAVPTTPPVATEAEPEIEPTTATEAEPVAEAGEPYIIGAFVSVTGPASSLGIPERDTVLMMAEQINAAGGIKGPDGLMHPVEVIVEDDRSDATEAVLIVKKLIEEGASVIVGGTGSPASVAVVDTVTEAQIPFISFASSSAIIEPVAERFWVFKTPQSNLPVAQIQADWLKSQGITKIASVGVNNAFGADSMSALEKVADEEGFEIVYTATFEPGDTDFSAQLTRVAGSDAEALIVHATPGEGGPLTVQFRDFGLEIPILHNHGIGNQAFIDLASDAAEGVMFPIGKLLVAGELPADDPQREVIAQYITDYQEYAGGSSPSTFGGHAWDGMQWAFMALQAVGNDPAAIRDYLEGIQNFAGISGVFNLSDAEHNGIGKESLVLVQIRDGAWRYVAPADYATTTQ